MKEDDAHRLESHSSLRTVSSANLFYLESLLQFQAAFSLFGSSVMCPRRIVTVATACERGSHALSGKLELSTCAYQGAEIFHLKIFATKKV